MPITETPGKKLSDVQRLLTGGCYEYSQSYRVKQPIKTFRRTANHNVHPFKRIANDIV